MSIRVSEKYGVNPSISQCYFCGETKNELMLLGRLKGDMEAPRQAVYNDEPCDKCKKYMEMGIILISVKNDDQEYRTGGFCVVKEEAVKRWFEGQDILKDVLNKRVAFISSSAWEMIGLPDLPKP